MGSSSSGHQVEIQCQGVLFDMDGILVSSLGSVERSWTKWAELRGVDPELTCRTAHGCRAIDTIGKMRPDLDAELELKVIEDIEIGDNEGLTVLPGVLEMLNALPADRWTVVTSSTKKLALVRLAVGGIPVPRTIIAADFVTRGKPHPEPFLTGAAALGFAPKDCVVFEDSASGSQAGRAAGCTVVATTFSHPMESLEAAHYIVEDLTGMRATVSSNGLTLRFSDLRA